VTGASPFQSSVDAASTVVIGDLHGAFTALQAILRGTGLVDDRLRWKGGARHLVQVGDVFNRSDGGRACFELLLRLRAEARRGGGEVTLLLGNHDVMLADGNEAYCTAGEYLAFASAKERVSFERRLRRAFPRFYFGRSPDGIVLPAHPRLEAWKVENVPGKKALRRAFGPRGRIGLELRRSPVAVRIGDAVVVHGGLIAKWAAQGIEGLDRLAAAAWAALDRRDRGFRKSLLFDPRGPLWCRRFAEGDGKSVERSLASALSHLKAERLIIGHTQTRSVPRGEVGRILTRFGDRVTCVDVGMRDADPETWAALMVDARGAREWKPSGERALWRTSTAPSGRTEAARGSV
jgi:hypothetical protein